MSAAVRGRPARRLDKPMVAVLEKQGRFLVAEPLFGPGPRTAVERGGADTGDLVLVGSGKRGARVLRKLGRPDRARDVVEGLMLDRGLYRSYPRAASAEADAAVNDPYAADARVDLRDLPTFTIDPDDARDFDDAISARRENGRVRLWVHIADVTAYLRPGTRLERETFRRGTSVYVPGAVEPMLPEVLSNEACSLRPGEDKLAVTVEMEMDGADVTSVAFHRSLVRSDRRLTYGEVDELFAGRTRAEDPWGEPLEVAREVARALRERRDSLEFGSWEPTFDFDSDGNPDGRPLRAADRVAPRDRDADDPRERAGGRVPGGQEAADALPRARAARAAVGHVPRRAAGEPRHPDAAAAQADDARSRPPMPSPRSRGSW